MHLSERDRAWRLWENANDPFGDFGGHGMRRRGFVDMSTRSRDLAVHDVEDRDVGGDLNRCGLSLALFLSLIPPASPPLPP